MLQNFDAVVGDTTIRENRSKYVDFTAVHGIRRGNGGANQRKEEQKCLGFLGAFDVGLVGYQFLFLRLHRFCCLGS